MPLINAGPFGFSDAQFDRDAGFYVFQLEPLQFVKGWAVGLTLITVIGSVGVYGYRVLLHGGDATATLAVRMQLAVLLAIVIGLFVWGYWLARFELVVSQNGTVFGATYTDVNVRQMVYVVRMVVGGGLAGWWSPQSAPSAATAMGTPRPMPELAPVTSAVFPSSLFKASSHFEARS